MKNIPTIVIRLDIAHIVSTFHFRSADNRFARGYPRSAAGIPFLWISDDRFHARERCKPSGRGSRPAGKGGGSQKKGAKTVGGGRQINIGKPVDPMPSISAFMQARRPAETDVDWEAVISRQDAGPTCEWEVSGFECGI